MRFVPQQHPTFYMYFLVDSYNYIMLNPPIFLLGTTLIFWGWQSQLILFAIPIAIILEAPNWSNERYFLTNKDFNHLSDLTSASLLISSVYLLIQYSADGLMMLLNWLPIIFLPLLVAQNYSVKNSIRLGSLFLMLRHINSKQIGYRKAQKRINLSYPYLLVCLLATSVNQNDWYFLSTTILIAWGLWKVRPRRYPVWLWGSLLIAVGLIAYIQQLGLSRLQLQVEQWAMTWFQNRLLKDPYQQNTAIGDIRDLKQSDEIILRVRTTQPLLLRTASYNVYFKSTWRTRKHEFVDVWQKNHGNWQFKPGNLNYSVADSVNISSYLVNGQGLLALPHNTYQVNDISAASILRNNFGTVKIEATTNFIEYTAYYSPKIQLDLPPTVDDLRLPNNEPYLSQLAKELNLLNQPALQVVDKIKNFFAGFKYSLSIPATPKDLTPIEHFLINSQAGHCEYFATTTALLLRAAGIPSRYVSGYAVEEFSFLEQAYLVRQRHAHAWTVAYINGNWQMVDNTPADWLNIEQQTTYWLTPFYDLISWSYYKFTQWRWQSSIGNQWLLWLILPLLTILLWRIYKRFKLMRLTARKNKLFYHYPGQNSAFYQLIKQLEKLGYVRQTGETLNAWLLRIELADSLFQAVRLHQVCRFDPVNFKSSQKIELSKQVNLGFKQLSERK